MDREGKMRRALDALGSVRSVNRTVVVEVLRCLDPESDINLHDLAKATRALTTDLIQNLAVEPVKEGGPATIAIARVQEGLPHILTRCEGYRGVFTSALTRFPNDRTHPWRLILYMDEITPGNPLHLESQKKITAIYNSFLELQQALRYEEAWMVNGGARTMLAHQIKGGRSGIIRQLLRSMFCKADSLSDAGVVIPMAGGPRICS